jgi:hypothetical protein
MLFLKQGIDGQAVDSQTNATATATIAAPGVGFKWRIMSWAASYSGAAVATPFRATLVANGITRGFGVSTAVPWGCEDSSIDGADNGAVSVSLPAGGVGAVGDVYINAIKIPTGYSGL